jgi:hypothetical protein
MDHTTANEPYETIETIETNKKNEINKITKTQEEPCLAAPMHFAPPAFCFESLNPALKIPGWAINATSPVRLLKAAALEESQFECCSFRNELSSEEIEQLQALLATLQKPKPEELTPYNPCVDIWSVGELISEKLAKTGAVANVDSIRTLHGFLEELLATQHECVDVAKRFPGSEFDSRRLCQIQKKLLQELQQKNQELTEQVETLQKEPKVLNLDAENKAENEQVATPADLVVKTLTGRTYIFRGPLIQTLTLRDLCNLISEQTGVAIERLRIIFDKKQFKLDDEAKMATQLVDLGFVFSNEKTATNSKNLVIVLFR